MGCCALHDCASRRRGLLVPPGLGLLASGVRRLLRAGRWRPGHQSHAPTSGRQIDVVALGKENQKLALVRRRTWLRQCAPSPGADSNRTEDPHATLHRSRPAIATLAHVASDHAHGMLQTGWHQELRQVPSETGSVRSAARGGGSNDFRLPCCGAGAWRGRVASRGDARVRLVSGRKRPADNADRFRDGQLLGWTASGSTQ